MFTKKQISETTWIILDDTKPFGFLRDTGNDFVLMVNEEKFEFASYNDVEKQFGKINDVENKFKDKQFVNDYPARHTTVNIVKHDKFPVYNSGGNILFVAGYFALKFSEAKVWQVVFGPKLKTVEANETIGPFKTRLEAMREVNVKNKAFDEKQFNN